MKAWYDKLPSLGSKQGMNSAAQDSAVQRRTALWFEKIACVVDTSHSGIG